MAGARTGKTYLQRLKKFKIKEMAQNASNKPNKLEKVKLQVAIAYIKLVMLVYNYQYTVFIRRQQMAIAILQLSLQLCLAAKHCRVKRTRKRKRSTWTKPRQQLWWDNVVEMDNATWKRNFRVDRETFNLIVKSLSATPFSRRDTQIRKCIPIEKRVAIALYTLTTTAEYGKIADVVGVGVSTVCRILHDFCDNVISKLKKQYLHFPLDEKSVTDTIMGFQRLGFSQCIGVVGSCHIPASPPKGTAWNYYNTEGWHSVILLAIVDSNHQFRFINMESPGCNSDACAYMKSEIPQLLESLYQRQLVHVIKGTNVAPLLLGDSAFPMHRQLVKPYPEMALTTDERIYFNYRHARVRRVTKIAFSRLKSRFKRISKRVECNIERLPVIVIACCILHNMCQDIGDTFDPQWCNETEELLQPCRDCVAGETDRYAIKVRDAFAVWFSDEKEQANQRHVPNRGE